MGDLGLATSGLLDITVSSILDLLLSDSERVSLGESVMEAPAGGVRAPGNSPVKGVKKLTDCFCLIF